MHSILFYLLTAFVVTISLSNSTVQGSIKNKETQTGISSATVMLLKDSTTLYKTESDSEGNYKIPNVVPGTYRVTTTANGFKPKTINGFLTKSNIICFLNIELEKTESTVKKSKRNSKYKQR